MGSGFGWLSIVVSVLTLGCFSPTIPLRACSETLQCPNGWFCHIDGVCRDFPLDFGGDGDGGVIGGGGLVGEPGQFDAVATGEGFLIAAQTPAGMLRWSAIGAVAAGAVALGVGRALVSPWRWREA